MKGTCLFSKDWREAITSMAPANTHTSGDNQLTTRIKVTKTQVINITKAGLGMCNFLNLVVVHDDSIKDFSKCGVCIRVTSIDTNTAVWILTAWKETKRIRKCYVYHSLKKKKKKEIVWPRPKWQSSLLQYFFLVLLSISSLKPTLG